MQRVAERAPTPLAPQPITPPVAPALVEKLPPALITPLPVETPVLAEAPEKPLTLNYSVAKPHSKPPRKPVPAKAPSALSIERKLASDTLTPVLQNAYQAYQRGDYASAAQGYKEVLQQAGNNRDALLGLGAIAQQQGQDQTAQHYYRQVLQLDPRDPVALGAMTAYSAGNGVATESHLQQLLAEQPRQAALHYALGNVYAEQARWADAQQAFFNARMLEPSNAHFSYNLAVSLDHLGQSKLAVQYYQQALQLDTAQQAGFDHAQAQQRVNELNH